MNCKFELEQEKSMLLVQHRLGQIQELALEIGSTKMLVVMVLMLVGVGQAPQLEQHSR